MDYGLFRVDHVVSNVPVGERRVWAHTDGHRYDWSDPIDVRLDVPLADGDTIRILQAVSGG